MRLGFKRFVAVVFGCAFALSSVARGTPVLTFTVPSTFISVNNDQSVGWQFNVNAATLVTGLGWYDDLSNGLSNAHQVGIWSPSGTLLASATVPAGTAAGFDGQFRTVSITPITLTPGAGYIVGGENFANSTDRIASDVPSQIVDPRITYVDATFSNIGLGFTRPATFSIATTGFYGPSFSVGIPEPAAAGALTVTACAMMIRRNRRNV